MAASPEISSTFRANSGVSPLLTAEGPFVSVVVPVWNDAERLAGCLRSLEKQTYPAHLYEVIVVDNGSTDSVSGVVASCANARVVIEQRAGSYAARNTGVREAVGEVIAFTDSDCLPAPDWIERAIVHLINNRGTVVAGRIEIFPRSALHPNGVEQYETLVALAQKEFVNNYGFGATANLFVFKEVFERVGYFLADLKSGGDLEWGRRLKKHDFTIEYFEDVCVRHPARFSLSQLYFKILRVTGGLCDLKRMKGAAYLEFDRSWGMTLIPPVRALATILREPSLQRMRDRIRVCGVLMFVRYAEAFEKLRLTYPKLWNHPTSAR